MVVGDNEHSVVHRLTGLFTILNFTAYRGF